MSAFSSDSSNGALSEDSLFQIQGKIVLILCGLIASGKSTFAEALQHYYPQFRRCNQDDLGDRHRVEQLARETLDEELSVCIDRTNFNAAQRSYWIKIAREFPDTAIWVIVFDTPYETCALRLQSRTSHPTIKSPEQGLSVLSRFAADFQHPAPHEGFDRILYVKPSDQPLPIYSLSDITAILQRIQASPPVISDNHLSPQRSGNSSFRGGSNRGRRSGWGDPYNHYYRAARGRGSNFNAGPSNGNRSWHSSPYRGNSVGLHGTVQAISRYPYARNQDYLRGSTSQGNEGQDTSTID